MRISPGDINGTSLIRKVEVCKETINDSEDVRVAHNVLSNVLETQVSGLADRAEQWLRRTS